MPPQIDFLEFVFGSVNAHQSNLAEHSKIKADVCDTLTPTKKKPALPGSKNSLNDFNDS